MTEADFQRVNEIIDAMGEPWTSRTGQDYVLNKSIWAEVNFFVVLPGMTPIFIKGGFFKSNIGDANYEVSFQASLKEILENRIQHAFPSDEIRACIKTLTAVLTADDAGIGNHTVFAADVMRAVEPVYEKLKSTYTGI